MNHEGRGLFMVNTTIRNTGNHSAGRVGLYLLLVALLSAFCYVTLHVWLLPDAVAYQETGKMTAGYLLYAAIGILFSTPGPFVAVLILSVFAERISVRQLFRNILHTEDKKKTALITGNFCAMALIYAVLFGKRNGTAWYLFLPSFLIMIPFVGIAEETGWRGLLQPEMEKRMPFPFSVLVTAVIWYAWHYSVWLDPTSRHYGDSMIGFGITILIWAFALAAIYKSTKSVIACAVYHAFIDAIGAIYDWNALFDVFPGDVPANVFRVIWLGAAILLWFAADSREKRKIHSEKLPMNMI